MKRTFTFLLTALFLCVGMVKAAVTDVPEMSTEGNTVWYTISNTRSLSGKYLYWTEAGLKDANTLSKASLFYFTAGEADTCYIHNAATDSLFSGAGAWTTAGVGCVISETPHASKAGVAIEFNGTALNEQNYADGFTTWSANDAGSIFVISPVVATIKEAVAKIEENKVAGNTIIGQYKYEEESYNALVAALAVLESAEGEEFFAAFESSVAAMASLVLAMPVEGKFYVIECPLFKQVQGVSKALNSTPGWNTLNLTDKNYYWTVEVNDGSYALKNVATGQYLNGTSMSDAPAYAKLNSLGQQQFNIVVNGTTVHANNHDGGKNGSGNIVSWGGEANSASAWQFIERVDPATLVEATVTYSFTYGGEEKFTQTTSTFVGEEWPAITVAFPYGVSASKPEGVVEVEEETIAITKVIELEVGELPFMAAENVESIVKWYYAKMHSNNPKYIEENAEGGINWVKATVDEHKTDSLLWGFVGNVFDGIKLVNKATGHAVVSTGGDAKMGDAANATALILSASATGVENGFCLKYPDSNNFLNAQGTKVASWSAADAGSTFLLEEYVEVAALAEIVGVTPAEGEVTELKEIVVQFSNDKILPYSNIYVMDEKENVYEFELDANHPDYTQAKYVAKNGGISAAGTYILDCSQIDHMDMMTGNTVNPFTGTFSWTIKASVPAFDTEIVSVTPAEGEVTELKEIVVQFSNDKILPYSNIYVMDEKENVYEFELDANHPDYTQAKYVAKNGGISAAGTYILDCSQIDHMDTMTGNTVNPFTGTFSWTIKPVEDGIDNINADAETVIYDIHGRRVTEMTKGVYIVNGKKVIKK